MIGDTDFTQALFGLNARRVPAWLYVQDQGDGVVSFVGASRIGRPDHPLRYGSDRPHQFVVGELVVRPQLVVATSSLVGSGLAGLGTADHDLDRMLRDGELVLGTIGGQA